MVVAYPVGLGLLLISIAPVEYFMVAEFARCDGLEGRAAKIEGEPALDIVKSTIGTYRLHAFMALVHNQQVPVQVLNPFQFVKVTAEIDGTFQTL